MKNLTICILAMLPVGAMQAQTVVFSEDFANGLAGNNGIGSWTVEGAHGDIWKRSINAPNGAYAINAPLISSTTVSNGYMLFNSDSANTNWAVNPPAAVGSPTSWEGSLVSPVIDLSATPFVAIEFQQRMRYCCGNAPHFLEISTDGGMTWSTSYPTTIDPATGQITANADVGTETKAFDITAAISGDPTRIKFRFRHKAEAGSSHYHWQIDDIRIVVCEEGPAFGFVTDGYTVSFNNQSSPLNGTWHFGDGGISTLDHPFHTYAEPGVYNVCLASYNSCLAPAVTVCQTVSLIGLISVTPNELANSGNFILDVAGVGLTGLQELRLVRNGQPDVVADSVIVASDALARVSFNFTGTADGLWSLQGVQTGGGTVILQDAVRLSPPMEPDLWVNIAGDRVLRVGFSQVYTVTIGNNGNMDAYWPTVFLENLPIGTEFVFLDSLYGGESVPAYDTLGIDWAEVRSLNLVDSTNMTSFFPFQVRRIPAHSVVTIGVIFHIPDTTELHSYYDIKAMVTGPVYTSAESEGFRSMNYECTRSVAEASILLLSELPGVGDAINCASGSTSLLTAVYDAYTEGTKILSVPGLLSGAISTAGSCMMAFGGSALALPRALLKYKNIIKAGQTLINNLEASMAGWSLGEGCSEKGPAVPMAENSQNVIIGNAWDPNEKYGPGGGSHGQYMNSGQAWPYTIGFENDPAANLPAQTVTVIDSLDLSRFDVRSFGFTSVTIGKQSIGLNGKPKSFIRDFDMQADMGVNTRVTASCDTVTGVVRWVFNTIDPSTGQITANALDGFLPPDTLSPNGQGYVSFVVDLLPGVADADSVRNKATIIFDFNAPIVTNTWQNVLDRVPPSSQVHALPPITAGDSVFVSWSGQDALSGVRHYTIYVSEDGADHIPWLVNTSDTSGWFHGEIGSEYRFYSLATDSAGNVEIFTGHDAITRLSDGAGVGEWSKEGWGMTVFPNPHSAHFTLLTSNPAAASGLLEIVDMTGRRVFQQQVWLPAGGHTLELQPELAQGMYLLKLTRPDREYATRIVRN